MKDHILVDIVPKHLKIPAIVLNTKGMFMRVFLMAERKIKLLLCNSFNVKCSF